MRRIKFVLIFLVFSLLTQYNYAQDSEYVYRDSSIIQMEAVITKPTINSLKKYDLFTKEEMINPALPNQSIKSLNDSAEILKKAESFAYAKKLDSLLKAAQNNTENKNIIAPAAGTSVIENFFSSPITKLFFWALAIFFIGFILYRLFLAEGIFQKRYYVNNIKIAEEAAPDFLPTTDFEKLIILAINNNNFRLAIRYHYLQTLQQLAAKGFIQFSADKTNAQYSQALYGNPVREGFLALTLHYEYAWYGDFIITETMFKKIENNFTAFNNNL